MSLVSTEEFLRRGHQIDLDMMNLDSAIQGINNAGSNVVPSGELMTWNALKQEWDHFYRDDVENVPILPWQSTSDLDTWLTRIDSWTLKSQKWAILSGNSKARGIVSAMPESPAIIQHHENPPSTGTPAWVWMLFGTAMLGTVGYTLGSIAKLK